MARYIDADKLIADLKKNEMWSRERDRTEASITVNKQPTVDVEEVKHGEWFLLDDCANEGVYCSVCHKKVYKKDYANQKLKSPRCPNCGAKMDGGTTNGL